ncbi:ABC transporter substrate-binding protein [Bosea sp. (in: a-proteobacteria)]|uniref:ABC transporter substrate-binding protein n=1 Tax=Bosea sp. (in: a-proteobacteria) TaxID=1871050 RepID=UPI002609AF31|nr:ABC transporter substrate-binding protein [Bosea sp. (in: a-proteobacteria)]MCO5091230.1 ABC transporter substrate-binding protein [Bosea sp. (in: a-proteobacteria)]
MSLSRRSFIAAPLAIPAVARFGAAQAQTPRDVVVFARHIGDILSLDPAEAYEFSSNEVCTNCYRKLVRPYGATIRGDLAESWEVSPDRLRFTFKLRPGQVFDGGAPVTADDVAFSLQRAVILGKPPSFILTQFGFDKSNAASRIRATDPGTVTIELTDARATSFVLYCLSANVASILEKKRVLANERDGDLGNQWLKGHSAGAGPFRLIGYNANEQVTLEANPNHATPVQLRRILIRHVPDSSVQFLMLQRGDADIARDIDADRIKTLRNDANFNLVSSGQGTQMYISMNTSVPELSKPQVHEAVKWAIDYDGIAENVTPGTWSVHQAFLPAGMPGSIADRPYRRDVARAKQLLAEAGYPDGFAIEVDHYGSPPFFDVAQALQRNLADVGIRASLLSADPRQVLTKSRQRTSKMALLRWSTDYFDPNSNAQYFCENDDNSENNQLRVMAWRSHWIDPELTAAVRQAAREADDAKRIAIYEDMQRQHFKRGPTSFLLQRNEVAVLRRGVTGLQLGLTADYTRYEAIQKS